MNKKELLHATYLHQLVNRLEQIEQKYKDITSIIQEPTWYNPLPKQNHTLCDIIILYNDFTATALELKGSNNQRHKALKQIRAGQQYIEQVLRYKYRHGLFVIYTPARYIYEII